MIKEINAILTIAYRDFTKFLRDRSRIIATFIFPLIFVGVLGSSMQANVGDALGYNFLAFTFAGVLGQVLFQSTAAGVISLVEDRENDFSQEIFITPISRYSIILGKILGETIVALAQGLGVFFFGLVFGVDISLDILLRLIPVAIIICFFGGAFGILVLSNLSSQRSANQIFPFLLLPQYFLAGVFSPVKELPPILFALSRIAPMTYAVDLARAAYYWGTQEYSLVILNRPVVNIVVIAVMFALFLLAGTYLFIRNERNK